PQPAPAPPPQQTQPAPPPPIPPAPAPGTAPTAPPPVPANCQPPPGHKGPFTPPPGCPAPGQPPPGAAKPPSLAHDGQFVLPLTLVGPPSLFRQITDWAPGASSVAWMPALGIGFGSGGSEFLVKFGGAIIPRTDDHAFMFGIERLHYFGSGTLKGIFGYEF